MYENTFHKYENDELQQINYIELLRFTTFVQFYRNYYPKGSNLNVVSLAIIFLTILECRMYLHTILLANLIETFKISLVLLVCQRNDEKMYTQLFHIFQYF